MKVLIVSLLRLGDVIQQQILIKGLREKHPGAEIHLLLNRQFANAEKVLTGKIDKFIYFERELLQKGLGEASYNILWSFDSLRHQVELLNQEKYDIIYNFTHNRLSAYLLGALEAPIKKGLFHSEGGFKGLDSRWIQYFNERFSGTTACLFNYVELLAKSLDIPLLENRGPHQAPKKSKLILFQCLTSDTKKNWSLASFKALKEEIERSLVDYEVCILGAPFEREILAEVFGEEDLLICDLAEARRHLMNAALLVTGDTSIKHLAAQLGTPIVELVLGSSDEVKTAAFTPFSHTVTSSVPCAPCNHSKACHQLSHLCSEDISVGRVFAAVWDSLSGERRKIAASHKNFERAIWSLYLERSGDYLSNYEALQFMISLQDQSKTKTISMLETRSQELHLFLKQIEENIPDENLISNRGKLHTQDIGGLILAVQGLLKTKCDEGGYFLPVTEALLARYRTPKQFAESIAKALQQARELLTIRDQYLKYLQSFSKEGDFYAKGIGQLSGCGFEEVGKGLSRDYQDADV